MIILILRGGTIQIDNWQVIQGLMTRCTWPHLDDKVTGTGFNDLDDIDDKLVENVSWDFSGTDILWCPKTRFWSFLIEFTIVMLAKFHVFPFQLQQHIFFNQITVLKRRNMSHDNWETFLRFIFPGSHCQWMKIRTTVPDISQWETT